MTDIRRGITQNEVDLLNAVCRGRSMDFTAEFTTCIPQIVEILTPSILSSQWVDACIQKPELHKQDDTDCLLSKEVFFEVNHWGESGAIYHGRYMARPIEKERCCGCHHCDCDEDDSDDIEYEYFFNANVGDELFDEDSIKRWMFVPEGKDS